MSAAIVLIDGAFFTKKYESSFEKYPTSSDIKNFVTCLMKRTCQDFSLLRVYYYDCPPLDKKIHFPISRKVHDLSKTERFKQNSELLKNLKRTDFFSVREGFLSDDGWVLKSKAIDKIKKNPASVQIEDSDFKPNISQKGVDMKIGLDIAWISLEKIAQRIILVTGDSDFIPAIKFARRSGIQVFLSTLNHGTSPNLKDHADCLFEDSIKTINSVI